MALLSLDKLAFFRDLGYEPHPGQLAVHRSRAPRRVLACGVRWGKTTAAAMEALAAALEPADRSIGWVVAPTYDLADKVFRELVRISGTHLKHRLITLREGERRILLRNLAGGVSELRGKSADNPVSLLGEGLDWLVVDEAARLKPSIWQSHLSQRLLDREGWALLISTPKGKGYFFDLFQRGQRGDEAYASWNYPSWTNPLLSQQRIEEERARIPERVFQQEYGAEFIEGAGAVFRNVRECARAVFAGRRPERRYVAGLDLAKVEDYTVLVVMSDEREVVFVDRFHRIDWAQQLQRIRAVSEAYEAAVLVDTTGAGEPIYEALRAGGVRAEAYPFTARSKNDLVNNLALLLEERQITLPTYEVCPFLIEELEAFEYSVTESGNVRTGAPSGAHDDGVIALALAAWRHRPREKHYVGTQFLL